METKVLDKKHIIIIGIAILSIIVSYFNATYAYFGTSKNEEISLKDLVYGLMLRSGNDASIAISSYVSNSTKEFVELMNKKAKEIGMKNTNFATPSGLDSVEHYSTARDMAILTRYALKNEEFAKNKEQLELLLACTTV